MSLTRDDVIRYLDSLPADELGALADEVLERLGAPPVRFIPALRPVLVTMGMSIDDDEESHLMLRAHGADKIAVIRILRRALGPGFGLAEVKAMVESAPVDIRVAVRFSEARALAHELRLAGAEVLVR